ncbi:hypothetical protein CPB86DRAFT_786494 [Serendipita vermifera]|nr:hypothetical protein CPB86DRAFT_786494 [Serendipita vermifera]
MATYRSDTLHRGEENIVISFDIGTTHSAVSFSYLYPGEYPEVRSVIKWPGQPESSGDSKIPTIVAYKNGIRYACGAEAKDYKDDEEYEIASWFKLQLHPESMVSDLPPPYNANASWDGSLEIPPLPQGVSLKRVYSDFIGYLCTKTKAFFVNSTPNGQAIWKRVKHRIVLIFCTPNAWEASQQVFLRQAVVESGLMEMEEVEERIEFITEGEASVHYAITHMKSNSWLKKGAMFTVIDAGGSTVDSTLYECKHLKPLRLEEVCASECVQAGGVFVDRAARRVLEKKLEGSPYNGDDYIELMVDVFEQKTKRIFDGTQTSSILQFGTPRDNDRDRGILKGKISLTRAEVRSTFEGVASRIMESCLVLLRGRKVQYLLLVGGFGESPFLRNCLTVLFASQGTDLVPVDEPSKKAAAEGSVIWYLKQLVTARAARYTIGANIGKIYDPNNVVHRSRMDLKYDDLSGVELITMFDIWAKKDILLATDWSLTKPYCCEWREFPQTLGRYSLSVYLCSSSTVPNWVYDTSGSLMPNTWELCTIEADMKDMVSAMETKLDPEGRKYWEMSFRVQVRFRGTKVQARLRWKNEYGEMKEGPATILAGVTY